MNDLIQSFSFDQEKILKDILALYVPAGRFDVDPTYSKGQFYASSVVPQPDIKFDLHSQVDGVTQADCRALPLDDVSIASIIFDPPFLATTGPSLLSGIDNNKINKRFGVYPSEAELHKMYNDALMEFWRVLKPDGVLVFKCQDKVSSGKQYITHAYVMNMAERIGFYAVDLFVLAAKNRLVAKWQKQQKHARKFHSYFWVFQKPVKQAGMSWTKLSTTIGIS